MNSAISQRTAPGPAYPTRQRLLLCGALLALPLLSACREDVTIAVEAHKGQVSFTVPDDGACIDQVLVAPADDLNRPIWSIGETPTGTARTTPCVTRLIYGQIPTGFEQFGDAAPLKPGMRYRVTIRRPGSVGMRAFTPGKDGDIASDQL